ncbi:hypothetical protein HID58_076305 [Brassica napus]|uniref:Uncharacterized protein n=1 Tax=Brassica napus TaxID=3708 RepID=A0ABQ7YM38_BRANA|nr:hypothetical protein HID58_076305 [Brassica napus]
MVNYRGETTGILVRFEKRLVVLQRRRHDLYTVERATKEKAKGDFFGGELTAMTSKEAAKPDEEAVNERNENFVSLADVLDAEHDPQLTMLPMMECGEEKEEGWGVWDGTVRFFIVNGQHGSCFGK